MRTRDLQSTEDNIYAAKLACRTFGALMATAAAFDSKVILDMVDNFQNSDIENKEVYLKYLHAYATPFASTVRTHGAAITMV